MSSSSDHLQDWPKILFKFRQTLLLSEYIQQKRQLDSSRENIDAKTAIFKLVVSHNVTLDNRIGCLKFFLGQTVLFLMFVIFSDV